MRVVALQLDIVWEDKPANLTKVHKLLCAVPRDSLVVLPEMFATGFTPNLPLAEDTGDAVAALAREYGVKILAGMVRRQPVTELTKSGPVRWTNEAVLYDPQGRELARYAKVHPFRPAGEAVAPGAGPVVVDCCGFHMAPVVCYDLRFPELFRACVKQGANLFVVIANWPTPRSDHWLTLLKARAIENQAYVIGVNRCGRDPSNEYPGRSQIISPRGEVLVDAGGGEGVISATLDLAALEAYRQEFPVLRDCCW